MKYLKEYTEHNLYQKISREEASVLKMQSLEVDNKPIVKELETGIKYRYNIKPIVHKGRYSDDDQYVNNNDIHNITTLPGSIPNMVFISDGQWFFIWLCNDEYFLVEYSPTSLGSHQHYKCDQMDGLVKLLDELI